MPTDLDRLQGSWKITSLETDGQRASTSLPPDARVIVNGDSFSSLGMGRPYAGTLTLGRSGALKTFDLLFTSGHAQGTKNVGIYQLAGNSWTICLSTQSPTRPTRFTTKVGSGLALEVLTRELTPPKTAAKTPAAVTSRPSAKVTPESSKTAPAGPPTEIEGEWRMLSAVFDGKPMADDMVKWCTRTTRGDHTVVMAGPQTMLDATFSLDSSKTPRAIDYVNLHGAAKGNRQLGIYELDGDRLSICMSPPGKPRPTTFDSSPRDGRSLTVWTRTL
jgi:uncharacterized protein (TIGR03067 family)